MFYRTGKLYCSQARPCIIQPGNVTGCGSEGVKLPSIFYSCSLLFFLSFLAIVYVSYLSVAFPNPLSLLQLIWVEVFFLCFMNNKHWFVHVYKWWLEINLFINLLFLLLLSICSLARTSYYLLDSFWLNLNYNPCRVVFVCAFCTLLFASVAWCIIHFHGSVLLNARLVLRIQRLLDQLESGEEMKAEDEQLNVVEEADFIQNERQLDLDDDDDLFDFVKKKSG